MSGRPRQTATGATGRRRFLQAGGALALLGLCGLGGMLLDLPAGRGTRPRGSPLESLFRSPRKARALGRRYLAMRPEAADRCALRARLGLAGGPLRPSQLRAQLAELRGRDFAEGRVVVLDGWVLAKSEAELCALISLG